MDVLLGRSDAVQMREAGETLLDTQQSTDERLVAGELLEDFVLSLDNAKDLGPLGLWKPLLEGLIDSSVPEIQAAIAGILGTAVQNNDKAQEQLLAAGGLAPLLSLVGSTTTTNSVRSKVLYAIASLIRHCPMALKEFLDGTGFTSLATVLSSSNANQSFSKKTVFLIQQLLLASLDTEFEGDIKENKPRLLSALSDSGFPSILAGFLSSASACDSTSMDEDWVEKLCDCLMAWNQAQPGFIGSLGRRTSLSASLGKLSRSNGLSETLKGTQIGTLLELLSHTPSE
jgi:hypothetical protein